jgi:DNA invertase Pin-like site-specific DNA recombinase
MVQPGKPIKAVIYARVSTDDQSCDRQIRELTDYAERCGYELVQVLCETASGAKNDRVERAKVIELARKRQIQLILISELTRWGRSTIDLIDSLQNLTDWKVSLIALSGMSFDLSTKEGKLMATLMSGIAEFERDVIRERVKSGLQHARRKGVVLGRPQKASDEAIFHLLNEGKSMRSIAKELGVSKTTVLKLKRERVQVSA